MTSSAPLEAHRGVHEEPSRAIDTSYVEGRAHIGRRPVNGVVFALCQIGDACGHLPNTVLDPGGQINLLMCPLIGRVLRIPVGSAREHSRRTRSELITAEVVPPL